jgi:CRP/FNR family transcriptional regulator, cyclic AMP receptor protein
MRKALHILGMLSDRDLEWLMSHGETQFATTGSIVIQEGRPINALFVLLDGKFSVRTSHGQDREVAILHPGEILGEISFVDARPPSASVVAVQDSHVFVVRAESLSSKLELDEGFASRFYRALATFLADRLRTTTARLGYGKRSEDQEYDEDELDDSTLDHASLAARRFDDMLKRLRIN